MLKMPQDDSEDPSSRNIRIVPVQNSLTQEKNGEKTRGFVVKIKELLKGKPGGTLREAIEEYIVEPKSFEDTPTISAQERAILANILALRDLDVLYVMVPRADIVAIDVDISKPDLFALLAEKQFSRIPVFQETLDDILGTVHIKDILAAMAKGQDFNIKDLISDVPVVSPSVSLLDLVLVMRQSRRHMAMVVDEYGGIDGLVTIGDLIETIIGEIDDEHNNDIEPEMMQTNDGSILVDGRVDLEVFEEKFGKFFSEEELEECDTVGGLASAIAGRVPVRGEVLTHRSGMVFEVLDADPRRVNRLRVTKIPAAQW